MPSSMLALQREQQHGRGQILARYGSIEGALKKREDTPFQRVRDGGLQQGKRLGYSIPCLPEDIWRHIHSLMPMRDAARAACLSRTFLHFWRCRPNLTLDWKTLCLKKPWRYFSCRVDSILRNHSGIGLKTLNLYLYDADPTALPCVEGWLQVAVRPGIEELNLMLHNKKYNFPCSLLSDHGVRNSIWYLRLDSCAFHPTIELGPLRSLTNLCLESVRISGDELECLLSNSFSLEKLHLCDCRKITFLEIPCVLLQLSSLSVFQCERLQVIEIKAPNLSHLNLTGNMKFSIGEASRVKKFFLWCKNSICYARAELPSTLPSLEALELISFYDEVVDTPTLSTKFIYLKRLTIHLTSSPSYDYFSLVSFFDASPSLETFLLDVSHDQMEHESVFGGLAHLRQLPECRHDCLKSVEIIGFSSAKGLVELTCFILKNAGSLEHLVLDTLPAHIRCSGENSIPCVTISKIRLEEAFRTIGAIRTYIDDEVPPTAKLTVKEPCARCHSRG